MRRVSWAFVTTSCWILIAIIGCGDRTPDPEYAKQLRAFAAAYHSYAESTRVSPTSLDDLKPHWGEFPLVRADIESGQFVVAWAVAFERTAAENDRYVLGY